MRKYGFAAVMLLLLVPVIWLFVLKKGKIVSRKLPVYGERTYDPVKKDTLFHKISPFRFIDQEGDTITDEDFDDCVYVANFFFTHCPDICPKMMQNMQVIYDRFKDAPNVKFLSHTVDPERDSVHVLAEYGRKLGAKPKRWYLVTGSKANLYHSGEFEYLLATIEGPVEDAFIHSEMLVLVDKDKRIRGYYDGTDYNKVKDLKDDIRALLSEYNDAGSKERAPLQ